MIIKAKWTRSDLLEVQIGAMLPNFTGKKKFVRFNGFFLEPREAVRMGAKIDRRLAQRAIKKLKKNV